MWDGTPFTSRIEQGAVRVAVDANAKAPFLIWSYVKEWREVEVPDEAKTLAGFEAWLPDAARKAGVDGNRPFAFRGRRLQARLWPASWSVPWSWSVPATAEGIQQRQGSGGESGFLLDDPRGLDDFAHILGRLLDDPKTAARVGAAAHRRVRERFLGPTQLVKYAELLLRLG